MTVHSLEQVVGYAREHSPFYRDLYSAVPTEGWRLADLPVIDQTAYWDAHGQSTSRVMTSPLGAEGGYLYKSGGTTGQPKFTVYTKEEWREFTRVFGSGLAKNSLADGDRIANLFYAGELYTSFIFLNDSLQNSDANVLTLPIGGAAPFEFIVHTLQDYKVNVLLGVPTTLLHLAEYVRDQGITLSIDRCYYGGEAMYPDQRDLLAQIFPGVSVLTVGYASVDAGHIGYGDPSCGFNEHRTFGDSSIIEIVDDGTGLPIEEVGREGRVVVTNLTRLLMPVIRYPAGDRGVWVDEPGTPDRRFRLLGRSEEGARVGPMTLNYDDIHAILVDLHQAVEVTGFQLVVTHQDRRDLLTLRIATRQGAAVPASVTETVRAAVYQGRPMFTDLLSDGLVHPLAVEWIESDDLIVNPRTGKLRRIVDNRLQRDR